MKLYMQKSYKLKRLNIFTRKQRASTSVNLGLLHTEVGNDFTKPSWQIFKYDPESVFFQGNV